MKTHLKQSGPSWNNAALIMGIPIDLTNYQSCIEDIQNMVTLFKEDGRPRYVATANVDFLVNALPGSNCSPYQEEVLNTLRSADMVTADGAPIVWLSNLFGYPLQGRVTGADLLPALVKANEKTGHSMFFLGGNQENSQLALETLSKKHPNFKVAGIDSPMVYIDGAEHWKSEEEDARLVSIINASGADMLILALGNPKQELWFSRNRHRLEVPVSIGVGGTMNFLSGCVRRAPLWIQKIGQEWVYRMIQEPRRLAKRYAKGLFRFSSLVVRFTVQGVIVKKSNVQSTTPTRLDQYVNNDGNRVIRVRPGSRMTADSLMSAYEEISNIYKHLPVFDFSEVKSWDKYVMADLCRFWSRLHTQERRFHVCGVSKALEREFKRQYLLNLITLSENFSAALQLCYAGCDLFDIWHGLDETVVVGHFSNRQASIDPFGLKHKLTHPLNLSGLDSIENGALAYLRAVIKNNNITSFSGLDSLNPLSD
jgi:N-acetylglucosaminyldiphosphoundecaprenol N-acetyl-beta-D-mannosaminyltransferase